MKRKVKLLSLLPILQPDLAAGIRAGLGRDIVEADEVKRVGGTELKRQPQPTKEQLATLKDGEQAIIQYVSTRDVDRDGDIMVPEGAVLKEFLKAPQVCEGHDYQKPPIAKDEWIEPNEYGLMAKTVYAPTPRGQEFFALRKGGFLSTSSIGFITLESVWRDQTGFDKLLKGLQSKYSELTEKASENVRRIVTKWLMLEHSDVTIPANPNALTLAVAKSLNISPEMLKDLGMEEPSPDVKPPQKKIYVQIVREPGSVRVVKSPRYVAAVDPSQLIADTVREQVELARGKI